MMPSMLSRMAEMIRTANHLCILCFENEEEDICPAENLMKEIEVMKAGKWEEEFLQYAYSLYREKWMEEHGPECLRDAEKVYASKDQFRLNQFTDEFFLSSLVGSKIVADYLAIKRHRRG